MTQAHFSNYHYLKIKKTILIGWKRTRSFIIENNNSLFSLYYYSKLENHVISILQ
jgi:hypothetical protein